VLLRLQKLLATGTLERGGKRGWTNETSWGKIWIPVLSQLFSMKPQREEKGTLKLHLQSRQKLSRMANDCPVSCKHWYRTAVIHLKGHSSFF